jgi:hypothetical protein
MRVSEAVKDLVSRGYSETRIAAEVGALAGVTVSQSSINRIKSGVIADPAYSVGAAIIEFHRRARKPRKTA